MPTRLLDLRPSTNDNSVKLVSVDSASERYAALSHCWGSGQPLKTLKESLASHTYGIDFWKLPRLFQEVVQLLRRLEIHYLWINTLCIIQDDPHNWEQESARMCQIFRDAFICIAALAAEDCTKPLIHDFKASFIDPKSGYTCRLLDWHCKPGNDALDQRAWALQETLLSRRLLIFSESEVLWHCNEARFGENDTFRHLWGCPTFHGARNKVGLDDSAAGNVDKMYICWAHIATEYSFRMITFDTDRLPALAGITTHFRTLLSDEPLLGLWRNRFAQGLTWEKFEDLPGTINPDVPTWSWLSINGSITYPHRLLESTLSLRKANISWSGTPLSSQIASCTVTVEGELSPVVLSPSQSKSIPSISLREESISSMKPQSRWLHSIVR